MKFWRKRRFKIIIGSVAVAYIVLSLPLSLIFMKSEYVRFIHFETVGHWKGKALGLDKVFCGDSITAGGRNWSLRMHGHPFDSVNLAGNSYTIRQIEEQCEKAKAYSPTYLFILAGTNDIINLGFERDRFTSDYRNLIASALESSSKVVVTLIPATAERREEIEEANQIIREICTENEVGYIDLNPLIAPEGMLLPEYTTDGVHFSPKANKLWLKEIQKHLRN